MSGSVPQPPPLPPLAPAASPRVVRVPRAAVPVVGLLMVAGFFAGIAAGRFASPSRPAGGDDVTVTPTTPQPVRPVPQIAIAPSPRPVVSPPPAIASAPMPRTVTTPVIAEVAVAPEPRTVAIVAVVEPKLVAIAVPATDRKADQCKTYDTKVRFFPNIAEAKDAAKADKKLVFVLHISGDFGDPGFT